MYSKAGDPVKSLSRTQPGSEVARENRADMTPTDLPRIGAALESERPARWLFTGDSITQGAKHTDGARSFPQHFEERVRFEMGRGLDIGINTAISGDEALDVLGAFDDRVARFYPTVVFVMLGTNDAVRGPTAAGGFHANLSLLAAKIRALGAIPVIQTPPPADAPQAPNRTDLEAYVDIVRAVARGTDAVLVDHYAAWLTRGSGSPPPDWLADAIHPNARGHAEMAATLFAALGV